MIVAMKMRIRIGVERAGLRPLQRHASADTRVRFLRPRQLSGTRLLPAPSASPPTSRATRKPSENERFLQSGCGSSDLWPRNRCCRKQKIKPCLTGARMHFCDLVFLRSSQVVLPPTSSKDDFTGMRSIQAEPTSPPTGSRQKPLLKPSGFAKVVAAYDFCVILSN